MIIKFVLQNQTTKRLKKRKKKKRRRDVQLLCSGKEPQPNSPPNSNKVVCSYSSFVLFFPFFYSSQRYRHIPHKKWEHSRNQLHYPVFLCLLIWLIKRPCRRPLNNMLTEMGEDCILCFVAPFCSSSEREEKQNK